MKQLTTYSLVIIATFFFIGCTPETGGKTAKSKVKLPTIDLTHWKVTIPTAGPNGKAMEVSPPEIFDFANNEALKPFMYPDSTDGSIVFHAFPASTTANTKYSRSELREQMVSGSNSTNWTFADGGYLRGKLSVPQISKGEDGKYHRTIVMQIHGRLTNEQRDKIGAKDNNAPPILKIYWDKGYVRVKTKILKDRKATDEELLHKEAWGDDYGHTFEKYVGHGKFTLEVKVEEGKMSVGLNGVEWKKYAGKDIERWGIFENYFKAGNYLQTRDEGAYAMVKYYELEVKH